MAAENFRPGIQRFISRGHRLVDIVLGVPRPIYATPPTKDPLEQVTRDGWIPPAATWLDQGNLGSADAPEFDVLGSQVSPTPPTVLNGHAGLSDIYSTDLVPAIPSAQVGRAFRNAAERGVTWAREQHLPSRPHLPTLPRLDRSALPSLPTLPTFHRPDISLKLPKLSENRREDLEMLGSLAVGVMGVVFVGGKQMAYDAWNSERARNFRISAINAAADHKNILAGASGFAGHAILHAAAHSLNIDTAFVDILVTTSGTFSGAFTALAYSPYAEKLMVEYPEWREPLEAVRTLTKYAAIATIGYGVGAGVDGAMHSHLQSVQAPQHHNVQPTPEAVKVIPLRETPQPVTHLSSHYATDRLVPEGASKVVFQSPAGQSPLGGAHLPDLPKGWHQPANGLKNVARLLRETHSRGTINQEAFMRTFRNAYGLWKDHNLTDPNLRTVFDMGNGTRSTFADLMSHGSRTLQSLRAVGVVR